MKRLATLLASGKTLRQLQEQLYHQDQLLARINSFLPEPLGDHLIQVIDKDHEWVILVDSPVWASRLRYQTPQLAQWLRAQGVQEKRIRVKVALPYSGTQPERRTRQAFPISSKNAALLRSIAETVNDEALKQALSRLSECTGAPPDGRKSGLDLTGKP
jgi:hypothetical protein